MLYYHKTRRTNIFFYDLIDREEMVTDNISMLGQPMTNRSASSKFSSDAFENFENVSNMFTCNEKKSFKIDYFLNILNPFLLGLVCIE